MIGLSIGVGLGLCGSGAISAQRDFNFAAGRYPPFTLTRTGAGTAYTAAGRVQAFATGVPRITDLGLLLEGEATNRLVRSQEFENASWIKSQAAVTANSVTAPDGSATADKIVESSGTVMPQASQGLVASSGAQTLSFFAKAGERHWLRLFVFQSGLSASSAWFNLSAGSVGTIGAGLISASMRGLADGWYRCTITFTAAALSTSWYAQICTADGGNSYTGDGVSGLYLWGGQSEPSTATSYIPTTTAAATRGADSASLIVPEGCTEWAAEYGASGTAGGSGLTPGDPFDLTTGRPWIGVGNELKRVRFF